MAEENPVVSIIVTSYNKRCLIGNALRSIQGQTFKNWEGLVVDDNSDDGTFEVIKNFARSDPRILAMKTDMEPSNHDVSINRYAHCINIGLAVSRGEFVTYLCDDDLYKPNRLELMVNYLRAFPDVFVVYGEQELHTLDESGQIISTGFRSGPKILTDAALVVDTSSVMHRRSCYEKVGGWPEERESWRTGDAYYWRKLNELWPFHRINHTTDVHRFNPKSVSYRMDHEMALRD